MNYTALYPEDRNVHEECCENMKSYIEYVEFLLTELFLFMG
jgi:hypothetical protein